MENTNTFLSKRKTHLATTEGNLEAKGDDAVSRGLEGGGEDVADLLVGHAGARGVGDLEDLRRKKCMSTSTLIITVSRV